MEDGFAIFFVAHQAVDMRTILEDLYYGNITPNEQQMTPGSELKRAVESFSSMHSAISLTPNRKPRMKFSVAVILLISCCDRSGRRSTSTRG